MTAVFQHRDHATLTQLNAETAARQSADTGLSNRIDSETAARTSADSVLATRVATVEGTLPLKQDAATAATASALATETAARQSADTALSGRLTTVEGILPAKADLVGGVIPTSQLPAVATNETVTVSSQAAMLALTSSQVQPGDVAIRSDQSGRRWVLAGTDPSVLGNWIALEVPDAVSSVNGQAGAVVLGAADVGAPTVAALTSETSARQSADTALDGRVTTNTNAIAAETSARQSADTALDTRVTANTSNIATNTANIATNTSAIAGKAALSHTHPQSDVTGLAAALAARVMVQTAGIDVPFNSPFVAQTNASIAANQARVIRFVPSFDYAVNLIRYIVTTGATGADQMDVGIYDASYNRIQATGAFVAPTTTGRKLATLPATVNLVAGTTYYVAFAYGPIAAAAAILRQTSTTLDLADMYGSGTGLRVQGTVANAFPLPATLTGMSAGASTPMCYLLNS